jgi:hypothetical protein
MDRFTSLLQLSLSRTFDAIVAWDSFFHLSHEHQRAMFPIFSKRANPGAPLLFTTGTDHGVAIGSYQGDPLYHASLASEEYRELLSSHGFSVVAHTKEDPDCGGHTVWLARRLPVGWKIHIGQVTCTIEQRRV